VAKPTIIPSESPELSAAGSGSDSGRFIDKLNPTVVNVVTILGFALPIAAYFWMVHRYSLNVIVGDQWDDMVVIGHSYTHFFDWSSLWAQHNENRIFFPNLIVLLLAHTVHFNVQIEEYLSAAMLTAATALIVWSHKRRSTSIPWLYYCPVALLAFSLVQYQNTLWGFQMAWYLVLLALAVAVMLLDRITLTWFVFIGAIGAGVVGSFSSLQGLLIWPAGLILLYHRRRCPVYTLTWIGAGVLSTFLYFLHFDTNVAPHHQYTWQHPLATAKFFVFALGDVVGISVNDPTTNGNTAVLLFGIFILVLAIATLVVYGGRRDETGGSPIGVALILVGLLFDVIVTSGRSVFGYFGASQSRYTTFDLLVPIGIYLSLLQRPALKRGRDPVLGNEGHPRQDAGDLRWRLVHWTDRRALGIARGAVAFVMAIQIGFGLYYGLEGARSTYDTKVVAARVLRNIDHEPDGLIVYRLYIIGPASFVRKEARVAQLHHLSLFSDNPSP
jgi:hypothetical protein